MPAGSKKSRPEFQVVLLAGGPGSRMFPVTEEIPKALLPVANRPLISYQLEVLIEIGLHDILVIADERYKREMLNYVEEIFPDQFPHLTATIRTYFYSGIKRTAEVLLEVQHQIHTDLIVMSGDLIMSSQLIFHLGDVHRANDSALTILLSPRQTAGGKKEGGGKKEPGEAPEEQLSAEKDFGLVDFIGLAKIPHFESQYSLLYFRNATDVEDQGSLVLSKAQLLSKFSDFTLHQDLVDPHLYILSHAAVRNLGQMRVAGQSSKETKGVVSIKTDVVPYIVEHQFSGPSAGEGDSESFLVTRRLLDPAQALSASNLAPIDLPFKAVAYVHSWEGFYCARANTLQAYRQLNREVLTRKTPFAPVESKEQGGCVVGDHVDLKSPAVASLIGTFSRIAPQCKVRQTVLGSHCTVEERVELTNCIIMDHVTISAGTKLVDSIVCSRAFVGTQCDIRMSVIGVNYSVPDGSALVHEHCTNETLGADDLLVDDHSFENDSDDDEI